MEDRDLPAPLTVYRSMGRGTSVQRVGAGVMDKAGITIDQKDGRTATWSMIYVLRGRGTYYDRDGRAWPLEPGWCFQRVPDRVHSTVLDPDSGWREVFIDLDPTLHRALTAMQALRVDPPAWRWGLTVERMRRFTGILEGLRAAGERQLPALLLRVLGLAVDAQPEPDAHPAEDAIDAACRALAEDPAGRGDLRAWCARQRLDYERFRKDFQRRVGMPPGQYRIRRRIDRACAMLQTTDLPIAAIAAELGYPSPYEFSAQFRARMGMPPTRYRAR